MKSRIESIRLSGFGVFGDFFIEAKQLAENFNCNVEFKFNGVEIVVNRYSDYQLVFDNYQKRIKG